MIVIATEEIEVKASADEAWKVYGSLLMPEMVVEILSDEIEKFEVVQGDGGLGTVLDFIFRIKPGYSGPTHYKEKFTVMDNVKRIKVAEGVEGGFLEMGLEWYRLRFDIIEKEKYLEGLNVNVNVNVKEERCITRATVEFETKDLKAAEIGVQALLSNVLVMKGIAERISNHYLSKL